MNLPHRMLNTGQVAALAWIDRQVPFWPLARIERLQRWRLQTTIRHAYRTVPYYRRVMDNLGLSPDDIRTADDLAKLPLIDDAMLRNEPEQFVSSLYGEHKRHSLHTSGTHSGHRTEVYWDEGALLRQLAHHERHRMVLNRLLGQGWGQQQLYILSPVSTTLWLRAFWDERILAPRRMVQRQVVSANEPYDVIIERLNAVRPAVVFSYGSYADHLARHVTDQGIEVAGPRVWMYGGDMLSDAGRQMLEQKLGCVVYSTYQTAEAGRVGFQCERCQGFHLNTDLCAVHLVDEQGGAVPAGERGEVVVSNLLSRAMVLLNLRLGDLAVIRSDPCPCGRSLPVLERLEGKRAEAIYLADGRALSVYQVENACREPLEFTRAAQLVQIAPQRLVWRVVPFEKVNREDLRSQLSAQATRFLNGQVEVSVEFVQEIPSTPQAKFRRLVTDTTGNGN
ncbi:MAG: phenylacetate--CoA ligase family protein [Anaerolineae bacterium]